MAIQILPDAPTCTTPHGLCFGFPIIPVFISKVPFISRADLFMELQHKEILVIPVSGWGQLVCKGDSLIPLYDIYYRISAREFSIRRSKYIAVENSLRTISITVGYINSSILSCLFDVRSKSYLPIRTHDCIVVSAGFFYVIWNYCQFLGYHGESSCIFWER